MQDENPDAWEDKLNEFMGRQTFVSKMKVAAAKSVVNADEMSFMADLVCNWPVYLFLGISSIFTAMLGFYMGTAPKLLPDGGLFFHTDPLHMFTAMIYMLAFVTVTEFPFALAKRWYYTREHNNYIQARTMMIMMGISAAAILGTGIAGGIVVASTIDFLSAYVAIPEWAQWWVVRAIPVLFVLYSGLLTIYHLSSNRAESVRMIRSQEKERALDAFARREAIQQMMNEKLAIASGGKYIKMVEDGMMTTAEARAKIEAEDTLMLPAPQRQMSAAPVLQKAPPAETYPPNGNGRH